VYEYVALWLVQYERPRTQSELESSFTFKMFFFQCINFYSSLVYIAFFKVGGVTFSKFFI
jgi:anoctamin-6